MNQVFLQINSNFKTHFKQLVL